ncbi:hypothetical protein OUZ56_003382 [Daphnia magna]|nr:hypothetical protein OUZ56_003382 [Daphnia magna]
MSPPRSIQPISSEVNLDEANQIAIILFFCLTHIVTPALKAFLCDNGLQLPATIDYDYAKMQNANTGSSTPPSGGHCVSVLATRRPPSKRVQVIYNFLIMREYRGAIENQVFLLTSQDYNYWENYLEAWIQLMEIINARTASAEMQGILETLMTSMNENQQIHLANVLSWLTNPVIPDILTGIVESVINDRLMSSKMGKALIFIPVFVFAQSLD